MKWSAERFPNTRFCPQRGSSRSMGGDSERKPGVLDRIISETFVVVVRSK